MGTPDDMHPLEEKYTVGQLTSAIQHFYTKLLHLKDNMNTEYARHLARGRHDCLVEFLQRFRDEWGHGLDDLGALGIAHRFYDAASLGLSMGTPDDMSGDSRAVPVSAVQDLYFRTVRGRSVGANTIDIVDRLDYMAEFLERFRKEWEGKL
jgi:hypothetical protein